MKLKRNEFDPLRLPGKVKRGDGSGVSKDPRVPIDPDDMEDMDDDG